MVLIESGEYPDGTGVFGLLPAGVAQVSVGQAIAAQSGATRYLSVASCPLSIPLKDLAFSSELFLSKSATHHEIFCARSPLRHLCDLGIYHSFSGHPSR